MFENHREHKAAKEYEEALTRWQAERDGQDQLLQLAEGFAGTTTNDIVLAPGEALFFKATGAGLIEERAGQGHWEGRSSGVSVPIPSIGWPRGALPRRCHPWPLWYRASPAPNCY